MLSKVSVKKPYTVLVGLVLVIILGFVSFTKMKSDLLPSINLSYAVVYTTYIGASPEEVEMNVTKPVESAMATVSDIKNIQSISSENISMVILEFSDKCDMDYISLEMREKLDQISGNWEDTVGKPVIMKLNPDMLPVMVAAVSVEGKEGAALTDYADTYLLPGLESIAGVASASASGTITESIQVVLRDSYIEKKNEEIQTLLSKQFADAREQLESARDELENNMQSIRDGQTQLESGIAAIEEKQKDMTAQMQDAREQMDDKEKELSQAREQLLSQQTQLTVQRDVLKAALDQLKKIQSQQNLLQEYRQQLVESKERYEKLQKDYADASSRMSAWDATIAEIQADRTKSDDEKQAAIQKIKESPEYTADAARMDMLNNQLAMLGITADEIPQKIREEEIAIENMDASIEVLNQLLTSLGYDPSMLDEAVQELEESLQKMNDGLAMIEDALTQLDQGQTALAEGQVQLDMTEAAANLQLYKAMAQAISGQQGMTSAMAQLESGMAQIDSGKKEIDTQEENTKQKLNLKDILSKTVVQNLLMAQNFSMPAGYIAEDGTQILIRVGDKIEDQQALADLVMADLGFEDMQPIRLKDVADVVLSDNSEEVYAKVNGRDALVITLQKQTGYSTGEVSKSLLKEFKEQEESGKGIDYTVLMNQGVYMDLITSSVFKNMIFGGLFAVLVLFLFLKNIPATLIVAVSIPISLLTALALMYFSNISINIISLSGLALGIGMLVDNSIVVIENIYRLRAEGKDRKEAAMAGAHQVAGAIIGSTLTTVCVFLPIVFTEGMTRQLFTDMGLTIGYSLLASLVIAMTFVPMASSLLLKKQASGEAAFFQNIKNKYKKTLQAVLKHKAAALAAAFVLLLLSGWGAYRNGTAYIPSMESTQVTVTVKAPEGSSVAETGALTDQVVSRILELSDVETVGAMVGGTQLFSTSKQTDSSTLYLILKEDKKMSGKELKEAILSGTSDLDAEITVQTDTMDMSALGGSGISLRIQGRDIDTLMEIAKNMQSVLENTDGIAEVDNGIQKLTPEFRIMINKQAAVKNGLTVAQAYQAVAGRLAGAVKATTLSTDEKDYAVYVSEDSQKDYTRDDIKNWEITAQNLQGEKITLKIADIADFSDADGLASIHRYNQQRTITVSAEIKDGYNVGLVSEDIKAQIDKMSIPAGYTVESVGEDKTINEAMSQIMLMLILAVVFVYLIMVAQFQSLLLPLAIMFTIPLAFTGGFLGLILAHKEISIIAMIGFVMLTGIIVNNGIVLVDYTDQLRQQGMEKREAIAEAGRTRLRPILMTALTTILGLILMAAGNGMGSDMVQPMAIVTIGGLLYGTFMTLYVVPCMYDIFK